MSRRGKRAASPSSSAAQDVDEEDDRIRMNMNNLRQKTIVSTPTINFDVYAEIGVLEDFKRLTTRVGFTDQFWTLPEHYRASPALTREFLASLQILTTNGVPKGIKFTLRGEVYKRRLSHLRN